MAIKMATEKVIEVFQRHGGQFGIIYHFIPTAILCDRYLTLLWLAIGIPGNIFASIVWTSQHVRRNNSSAIFLAALSLSDLCLLLFSLFADLKTAWNQSIIDIPVLCEGFNIIYLAVQYLWPLFILAMTVERSLALNSYFGSNFYTNSCTSGRTLCAASCLLLLAVTICIAQGLFGKISMNLCSVTADADESDVGKSDFYKIFTLISDLIMNACLPLIILTMNILIMNKLHRLVTRKQMYNINNINNINNNNNSNDDLDLFDKTQMVAAPHLPPPPPPPLPPRNNMNNSSCILAITTEARAVKEWNYFRSTTIMILTGSFYCVFTLLPKGLISALELLVHHGGVYLTDKEIFSDQLWQQFFRFRFVKILIFEIALSHTAVNILIYFIFGKLFRNEIKRLFCCCNKFNNADDHDAVALSNMEYFCQNHKCATGFCDNQFSPQQHYHPDQHHQHQHYSINQQQEINSVVAHVSRDCLHHPQPLPSAMTYI